ncbi:hypothetical protein Dimus_027117 [Dionaea muscipula]
MRSSYSSSSGRINIAASTRKLHVDNRLSLRIYYRIADNILRQADIFRAEKNMIDLYIMLLRFSSLVSETIPDHRDYRTSPQTKRSSLKKQLLNAVNELEGLKPVVELKIVELDRKHSYPANGWDHPKNNVSVAFIESPRYRVHSLTNDQSSKLSGTASRDVLYRTSNCQQWRHTAPLQDQFQRLSLKIVRPKEETLSKHSILGSNELHAHWHPPISKQEIRYPNNVDVTPDDIARSSQAVIDVPMVKDDRGNVECPKSSLLSTIQEELGNLVYMKAGLQISQGSQASEPSPMISFETSETCPEVIVRQPSAPPILAEVHSLVTEIPPQVTEMQDVRDALPDNLDPPESPMELHISTSMMDTFMALAQSNTSKNLETCGVLAGSLKYRKFYVTALIIPKQESTSNSCQTTSEEEIFEVQDKQSLFPLGWIHTHPTQSCFMSSIDLHTHYSYQIMLQEAVAIVMAPKDSFKNHGIFRLTSPGGMSVIRQCELRGFHPHEQPADGGPIYKQCTDVYMNPKLKFDVIDLR